MSPEVVREGKDITVVAVSWMVVEALKMADAMSRLHGVEVEVIDIRTTNPSFHGIYQSVNKTRNCMVADYDWEKCGFGEHIAYQIMKEVGHLTTHPVWVNGFADEHCPTARHLEDQFYTNAYDLIRVAEMTLGLDEADLSGEEFYSYENKFKGPF